MAAAVGGNTPLDPQRIEIHIPKRVYWGGDAVYGAVELNTVSELKSYGVIVEFEGYERGMYLSEPSLKHRYARNTFIHRLIARSGSPFEKEISITPEGRSVFPFAFKLPSFLPPSINREELKDCWVVYSISAYLAKPEDNAKERPGDLLKTFVELDVGGSLQDQMHFSQPHPVTQTESTKFLMSGKMKATVSLDTNHLFTQESFNVLLDIDNDSGKKIQAVVMEIVCTIKFKAVLRNGTGEDTKKKKITFESFSYDISVPEKTHQQIPLVMHIANDAPSLYEIKDEFSPILSVSHKLRVKLDLPWATDLIIKVPVVLQRRNKALPSVSIPIKKGQVEGRPTGKVLTKANSSGIRVPIGEYSKVNWAPCESTTLFPVVPFFGYPDDTVAIPLNMGNNLNPDALYAVYSGMFGSYNL